jgi:hypothetical protein
MSDDLFDSPTNTNKPLIAAGVAVVVAAVGGWYYWHSHKSTQTAPPVSAQSSAPAPEAVIEHPVPAATDASKGPLPELNDSDKAMSDALGAAAGSAAVASYLVPESIIRHIVVTIDNMPRQKVTVEKRPIAPAPGTFAATGDELHATLAPQNFQRYAPMIGVLRNVDMQRLAAVYLRFYPLFQNAYQGLGYPNDYFNDRLVKVIDMLLATPQIAGPIDLVRPNVMYVFADQSLESRPAGQKLLIRMGPDNAAVVKAKLSELRAIVTAAPLKR